MPEISRLITPFTDDFLAKEFRNEKEFATLLGHFDSLFHLTRVGFGLQPGEPLKYVAEKIC